MRMICIIAKTTTDNDVYKEVKKTVILPHISFLLKIKRNYTWVDRRKKRKAKKGRRNEL